MNACTACRLPVRRRLLSRSERASPRLPRPPRCMLRSRTSPASFAGLWRAPGRASMQVRERQETKRRSAEEASASSGRYSAHSCFVITQLHEDRPHFSSSSDTACQTRILGSRSKRLLRFVFGLECKLKKDSQPKCFARAATIRVKAESLGQYPAPLASSDPTRKRTKASRCTGCVTSNAFLKQHHGPGSAHSL